MSTSAPIDTQLTDGAEALSAEEVIARMVERFHPRLLLASSFQQEESVMIDLLMRVEPSARIFTLDTGVLFPETYETWKAMEQRYGIEIEAASGISLAEQAAQFGDELWAREPDRCCAIRKVTPLREILSGVDGWIVGVRRDQAPDARRHAEDRLGRQARHLEGRPARRLERERRLAATSASTTSPTTPSTTAATPRSAARTARVPAADRSGRWAGSDKLECGLHG